MPGDWYTTVAEVADRLANTAKSSYEHIHDSLSDLTSGIDSTVFNVTTRSSQVFTPTPPVPPPSQWDRISTWATENKYAIAAATTATSVTLFMVYRNHTRKHRKRRAARTANASRKEVLVITNFTANPLTRNIAHDLERRGFIVFCVCHTPAEKHIIENEGHADIRPLALNGDESYTAIERFATFLSMPAPAYHGGHTLHFAGMILSTPVNTPNGPLETIDADHLALAIDQGVTQPAKIMQNFLPLLREHQGRILFLSDWIIPSLQPPFYSVQSLTAHSLLSLSRSLARECPSLITIFMKLGTFEIGGHTQTQAASMRAGIQNWSPTVRQAYAGNYRASTRNTISKVRGSPVKDLQHAVFDALTDHNPTRELRIGAGSYIYPLLSTLLPELFLRYLLDVSSTPRDDDWEVLE